MRRNFYEIQEELGLSDLDLALRMTSVHDKMANVVVEVLPPDEDREGVAAVIRRMAEVMIENKAFNVDDAIALIALEQPTHRGRAACVRALALLNLIETVAKEHGDATS